MATTTTKKATAASTKAAGTTKKAPAAKAPAAKAPAAKAPAAKSTAANKVTLKADHLPDTPGQYRHKSGTTGTPQADAYKAATRALAKWAGRGTENAAHVHALVHLGWCSGSGARANCNRSSSTAFASAEKVLKVGEPAAPQIVEHLEFIREAGAPEEYVTTIWETFTGTAALV